VNTSPNPDRATEPSGERRASGAPRATNGGGPTAPATPEHLTRPERRLRGLLWVHALICVAFAAGYLITGKVTELGFVPNSVGKDGLFTILSVLGAANVRKRGWTAPVLAAAYVCLITGEAVSLARGNAAAQDVLGFHVSGSVALLGWMAIDVVLTGLLISWWLSAERARLGLRYLNAVAFHGLAALADVLIEGADEKVPPAQIARNVDHYLHRLTAAGKARVRLALTVLGVLPPWLPMPLRAPAARKRLLSRHFIDDVAKRRLPRPARTLMQALVRTASQMAYLGYYGDPASWPSIGYVPFPERRNGRQPQASDHPYGPLKTLPAPPRTRYDVVIVGSGAAGSILAYRFAEAGRRVLLLERGPYADPREFAADEVQQYLKLYNEGALTLAKDFRLQVLQGMCVGGGTTVNNGVCLDPPGPVLDRWAERGIDRARLEDSIREVRAWLRVSPIADHTVSPGAKRFVDGVAALELPGTLRRVETNLLGDCLGCGYCNIGCGYGKRESMLDRILPEAQRLPNGTVDVLPEFRALRIVHDGDRAVGVLGEHRGRAEVCVLGDEIILAAGAVASSWLLQRSGIGGDRAGAALHFNINSPVTADFPEPVDTYAGLQMTHAYEPPGDEPAYLLETWFNPPATQALAMPGWFDRHYANMRRYRHMAAAGALVGTTHPARITATAQGPNIDYTPSAHDLGRLVDGIKQIGAIYFAAGAERVMPATFAWRQYRSPAGLADLDRLVHGNADLLITTAHPQSGNPIGEIREGGVVRPDFRVHGFANLYLCDASAFPSSVGVNPQLAVMGLAQLAAHEILGTPPVTLREWEPPPFAEPPVQTPAA
jgi:choline dehydrogenase-like flavoprotein